MSTEALDAEQLRRLIDAGRALVSELDLEAVLSRVIEAGAAVTGARYAALGVLDPEREHLERFLTHGIDSRTRRTIGDLPRGRGVLGVLIDDPRPLRLDDVSDDPRSFGFPESHPPMRSFLGVPVMIRGQAFGNLYLTEKESGGPFTEADEESAVVLADWAAIAVANARSVESLRLRQSIESAERERRYWARELHDETLQGLGAVRLQLASMLRTGEAKEETITDAIGQLGDEIKRLRGLITDLRPDSLDRIGLGAALEALAERMAGREAYEVKTAIALAHELRGEPDRLDPELEIAIYRIVQEALTNAGKHGRATQVEVRVVEQAERVRLSVSDDGSGFDPSVAQGGFGLTNMRERAGAVSGAVEVESAPGRGTVVTGVMPVRRVGTDT